MALLLALGPGFYSGYVSKIPLFGNSLIIQFSIIWSVAAIVMSIRYSKLLFERSHDVNIRLRNWVLTWALTISGCVVAVSSLWVFGEDMKPAHLVSDMAFILAAGGGSIGLILLPILAGGYLCHPRTAIQGSGKHGKLSRWRKLARFPFGAWHAILQIGTPYLFANHILLMTWAEGGAFIVITAGLIALMWPIGGWMLKNGLRKTLAFAWAAYGAATLALPWMVREFSGDAGSFFPIELRTDWSGLWWPAVAGVAGAVMSCVWFGWYLGVCFAFNGHNNEVGGACRIEEFKQFIRFRLTENGLTGYVIAIDRPCKDGKKLEPKLVDVFHLRVKPAAGAAATVQEGGA
jgi:hypothetical protein